MARIWVISDLHCELMHRNFQAEFVRPEADVLVIAGDLDRADLAVSRAGAWFPDIPIVMVAGNHEHYRSMQKVGEAIDLMRSKAKLHRQSNAAPIFVLENETVEIDCGSERVRFIGATLWTDFNLYGDPRREMCVAEWIMNDFRLIRGRTGVLTPEETVAWHKASRTYLERALRAPHAGKTVVVTHHLPSVRSVADRFRNIPLSAAFASNCDDLLALGADLWIHGHTHDSFDYRAGRTRIVCNPRGYQVTSTVIENGRFRPGLVVEI